MNWFEKKLKLVYKIISADVLNVLSIFSLTDDKEVNLNSLTCISMCLEPGNDNLEYTIDDKYVLVRCYSYMLTFKRWLNLPFYFIKYSWAIFWY